MKDQDFDNYDKLKELMDLLDKQKKMIEHINNLGISNDGYLIVIGDAYRSCKTKDIARFITFEKFNSSLKVFKTLLEFDVNEMIEATKKNISNYKVISK